MAFRAKMLLGVGLIVLLTPPVAFLFNGLHSDDPVPAFDDVVADYLRAVYAQDQENVYRLVSERDHLFKSEEQYLRENPPTTGTALDLSQELAKLIEIRGLRAQVSQNRATVRFAVRLPDANSAVLQRLFLEFDPERMEALTSTQTKEIKNRLKDLAQDGQLAFIAGEESLELVKEGENWRIFQDWADAIKVNFRAEVRDGLRWHFEPLQKTVLAKRGETLHAAYTARNLADVPLTAKARHIDTPEEMAAKYLEIIQCFCFLRETLAPGEKKELGLVFRVDFNVPPQVKEFTITYQFYPIDKFPASADDTPTG